MIRNKSIIVTGAASGIGAAIAKSLLLAGYNVMLVDLVSIDSSRWLDSMELSSNYCHQFGSISGDVSNERDVDTCVQMALEKFGMIYGLINNAGISPKKVDGTKALVEEIALEEWDHVIRVNLRSVFLFSRRVLPLLKEQHDGSIVNISSSAALDGGWLAAAHYTASKGAVAAMSRTLAVESAAFNINVNCIAPGRVDTPMAKLSSAIKNQGALDRIPMQRFANSEEIARLATYLISTDARYITGTTINISGGYVIC